MAEIRFYLASFGCQMNKLDADHLLGEFRSRGWKRTETEGDADVVLYLTCSVREKPEEKVFSRLAQVRKQDGRPVVCVAGCMAQRMGENILERASQVDLVLGTGELARGTELLTRLLAGKAGPILALGGSGALPARDPAIRQKAHQAFVAAARGCSKSCAYCVVPATRGPERSRPQGAIVDEAAALLAAGVKEITLIAQSISGFGRDLNPPATLADLLEGVHRLPGLLRLRFLTSHPADLNEKILQAMADLPKVCNHLHLPAQSGSDRILEAMARGYRADDYLRLVDRARARVPDVEFTSDFILGFPGETESDFQATVSLVERVGFQNIFVFQYSPRPGTSAFTLPDPVPKEVKRERNHALLRVQERIAKKAQEAFIGREVEILVEGKSKRDHTRLTGRTKGNRILVFPAPPDDPSGRLVRVRVESATPLTLFGELVSQDT